MTEAPVQFIIPLEEATVPEGQSVTFTCETTEELAPAKWYKDGKEIVPSDHMKIESKGKVHKLIIPKADIDDRAEYTVKIKDKVSKAPLFVEGNDMTSQLYVVPAMIAEQNKYILR
jgi:hypothetical protein